MYKRVRESQTLKRVRETDQNDLTVVTMHYGTRWDKMRRKEEEEEEKHLHLHLHLLLMTG